VTGKGVSEMKDSIITKGIEPNEKARMVSDEKK